MRARSLSFLSWLPPLFSSRPEKAHTDSTACPFSGSNVIVAGTALFGAEKPAEVITDFKRQVDESRTAWGADETLEEAKKLAKA